jgi:hypothetical protein
MHFPMLLTITLPDGSNSEDARRAVHEALIKDSSFCGGGRFGCPLCDWFVIGGRFSGLLTEATLGFAFEAAVSARFPEGVPSPLNLDDCDRVEYEAIWRTIGGMEPSPKGRDSYAMTGHPDDAVILTDALYDALLANYKGNDIVFRDSHCEFADLDEEELDSDFVGRKWIVVVDQHV